MADILKIFKARKGKNVSASRKNVSTSIYSMVSCSDLTPGSLDVWLDLPDEIKNDPALANFKQLYEQHHGADVTPSITHESDKTNCSKKPSDLTPIGGITVTKNNNGTGSRPSEPVHTTQKLAAEPKKKKRLELILHVVKLSALVACWVLLTTSLLMNGEKTDVVMHAAVTEGFVKEYLLQSNNERVNLRVTLTGPFLVESYNKTTNPNMLQVWLTRTMEIPNVGEYEQNSTLWMVPLRSPENMEFSESVTVTETLILQSKDLKYKNTLNEPSHNTSNLEFRRPPYNASKIYLRMRTSNGSTVPLTVSYFLNPMTETEGLIYAAILLCSLYVLIIFEIVNRTIAALLSSSLGVAVLAVSGARPSLPELVSWLDLETLLLLISMMLLVAILADTGVFDHLAVVAFEVTGGRTWPLINCLCFFTAFFSTFLDNVTTVLLMTPVTIRLCEVMQLNPVPVLMSMVIFSNVGGAATPVGDPPNVIIASHPAILKENINFTSFSMHMGVGILLVALQTYLQLRYIFRDMNTLRHSVPVDIQEMRQEIAVWRRAAASLTSYSRDEDIVRKALEKKVNKLNIALKNREAGISSSRSDPKFCSTLAQMKEKYHIRDKPLLIKSAVCVTFVVVVFFLHAIPELQRLSLGWTALLGAMLLLLLADRSDLEPILARVEWSTLLFFAALFVLMETLSMLGLIVWIGNMTEKVILQVGEESRLAVALMLVLWVSGIASAFVDNIPLTTMMVRVIATLADPNGLNLPLPPLAWALSFGACLGGNGTLIGASANVVCAGVAEQHGYRFTFLQYLKVGFPVMVGNLVVSSIYLLICHCAFTWH